MAKQKCIILMGLNTQVLFYMAKEMDKAFMNQTINLIKGHGRIIGSMEKESITITRLENNIVDFFKMIKCMERVH